MARELTLARDYFACLHPAFVMQNTPIAVYLLLDGIISVTLLYPLETAGKSWDLRRITRIFTAVIAENK
jgi:hypothetical protein